MSIKSFPHEALKTALTFARVVIVFLIFLILPVVNDTVFLNSTIFTKTIFFSYGLLLLLGVWTLDILFRLNAIRAYFSKTDIAFLLVILFIVVNRYFIQLDFGFSLRFIELIGLVFFYFVLRHLPIPSYPYVCLAIILSGIVQAVYGNLQLLGYFPSLNFRYSITGSFFNPGSFGGFLSCIWTISLGVYLYRHRMINMLESQNPKNRIWVLTITKLAVSYLPLIGMVTCLLVLPAIRSRSSWLAVLAGTVLLFSYRYGITALFQSWSKIKKMTVSSFALIILAISFYSVYHFKKDSADGRVLIWKITSGMILKNPLFGVGYDRFSANYMDEQASYFKEKKEAEEVFIADNTNSAFNETLQFLSENGLIGFLLILMLIYIILRSNPSKDDFLRPISIGLLATVIVFGSFSYPSKILPIKIMVIFALAVLAALADNKDSIISVLNFSNTSSTLKWVLPKVLIVSVSTGIIMQSFFFLAGTRKAYISWRDSLNVYNYQLYDDSLIEFEKSFPYLARNGEFLMNYSKALFMAGKYDEAIETSELTKKYLNNTLVETTLGDSYMMRAVYEKAEQYYQNAANMVPNRLYPHYLLAKLYKLSGHKEKAIEKANEVLKKKAKVPSKAEDSMKEEMKELIQNYNLEDL